ncbi:hypothetical protein FisN_7Lh223 [Fistulifera solaris]|uniref:Uncharacterized protein n=1 Tax=Fistulifera solaris TaxID=1519565 RepID=A0A1Z5JRH9_FISSO|nr:hypothetical protein FisN_7Lh223 [Fistulifera solaris]|eukprot:GAX16506.1 hypothetical protein FisN_7Lh223 [Fistulifera solaris]
MTRVVNCLTFMVFVSLAVILCIGTIVVYEHAAENKDSNEQTPPVTIDGEGIVQNGPFRTCECSGNIFFGEDRVECLPENSHLAGDVVVFCIWNEMLQIRAIDHVFVKMNQNRTYQLIQHGIPDIHTQSFIQTRAALVTTVLDPVWFLETSTILGLQVKLQGEATFQTTDAYDMAHLMDIKRNPYRGLRQLAESAKGPPDWETRDEIVFFTMILLGFLASFLLIACMFKSFERQAARMRRAEHWEQVRRMDQREFEKHWVDHGEPHIVTIDVYYSGQDDHTSTTAQISAGDNDSVSTKHNSER